MTARLNGNENKTFVVRVRRGKGSIKFSRSGECTSRDGKACFETTLEVITSLDSIKVVVLKKGRWDLIRNKSKVEKLVFVPLEEFSSNQIEVKLEEV